MTATQDQTRPASHRSFRRAGAAVLATLLLAGVMLGASFSVFGHGKGSVASASVRVPHSLIGPHLLVLDIPGISGESMVTGHPGGIDIESFSWGISNSASPVKSSISGAGKVAFQDLSFTKQIDRASPALLQACASRTLFPTATFDVVASSDVGGDAMKITMNNVFVSSCAESGVGGAGSSGQESFSLNFAKIKVDYSPQGTTKPSHMGWDLKKNVKA